MTNFFLDLIILFQIQVLCAEEKHIRSVKSAATDRGECLTAERGFCLGSCRLEEAAAAFFFILSPSSKEAENLTQPSQDRFLSWQRQCLIVYLEKAKVLLD
ncbi:MAG: hypothetical protein IK129_00120 [Deltaproteobacteria bacterium]|nr:hypothetical protein [Deltaproteobacteria bacterium]